MSKYNEIQQLIIKALVGRDFGTKILPENHQGYEFEIIDWIKEIELNSKSIIAGSANFDTIPIQPQDSYAVYISSVSPNTNVVYQNFIDNNGVPIQVTTTPEESFFVIFIWNKEYWSINTTLISTTRNGEFYETIIHKTYTSKNEMINDVVNPIGTDGNPILIGQSVSVVNILDNTDNGIYVFLGNGWQFQQNYLLIANEMGDSITKVMSQKSTTDAINSINFNIINLEFVGIQDGINKIFTTLTNFKIGQSIIKINGVEYFLGVHYKENSNHEIEFFNILLKDDDNLEIQTINKI